MHINNRLSRRQLQVMEILWNSPESMTASAIEQNAEDLQINTVQASLRSLIKKEYIKVDQIVYSGTVLTRSYKPIISYDEYLAMSCEKLAHFSSPFAIMANFVDKETDEQVLNELEELILKRKKQLRRE